MEKYCPMCRTEMIDRCNYFICPRNNIGECVYDGYEDHHSHYYYDNREHIQERELVTSD